MSNFDGVIASRFLEYGYGVGYGMCFGAVVSNLGGWHLLSDEPPQQAALLTGSFPKNFFFEKVVYDSEGRVTSATDTGGLSFSDSPNCLVSSSYQITPFIANLPLRNSGMTGYFGTSMQRYYLYDQIHIIPNLFSLGAVPVDRQVTAKIWSAFFEEKTATAINYYNASGVSEDLNDEIPYTFKKLEERDWIFSIDAESGSAVITAKISIVIDGIPYDVDFTGVRAQAWTFIHNWKDPLKETLEWKTAMNVTYDGTESRAALIDTARRSVDYTLYLKSHEAKKMENSTFGWQNRVYLIPVLQYFSKLDQAATVGNTVIYLDTVDKGFAVGSYAMLYNETTGLTEPLVITGVASDSLTLQDSLTNAWSKYATVYVAEAAYVQGNIPINWQTKDFAEGKVKFQMLPAEASPFTPSAVASQLYRSEEVLTREPDWSGGIDYDMTYESGVIDSGTGVVFNYTTWKRPQRVMTHSWMLKGLSDIRAFREFIYRRRGMAVSFWMPSWRNDFRSISRTYLSGATQFEFYDDNFILMSAGKIERQHIQVELNNGSVHRAKISAYAETSPGVVGITLNSGYPWTFTSSDIKRVSWLSRFRLNSDAVELEWVHARLVRVSLQFATVPDYPTQDAA